jgi:hypothetical protein
VEKKQLEVTTYEKPEVKDFGDLRDLTEGGSRPSNMDSLWPNNVKAHKDFS